MTKFLRILDVHFYFTFTVTNAIEALKYEFLADPGIIRPEFAGSFLSRA